VRRVENSTVTSLKNSVSAGQFGVLTSEENSREISESKPAEKQEEEAYGQVHKGKGKIPKVRGKVKPKNRVPML
jgi:hypothetical protein